MARTFDIDTIIANREARLAELMAEGQRIDEHKAANIAAREAVKKEIDAAYTFAATLTPDDGRPLRKKGDDGARHDAIINFVHEHPGSTAVEIGEALWTVTSPVMQSTWIRDVVTVAQSGRIRRNGHGYYPVALLSLAP
jgi:hypothetical protein